VGEMIGVKS